MFRYPRMRIRSDLVDAHLYFIKKSALDIAIRSRYSSFRKEFLPQLIRQLATDQPLEHLLPSNARPAMQLHRQTSSFFSDQRERKRDVLLAADLDDYGDLSQILAEYQSEKQQIQGGCYYSIGEGQLFRVKNVVAYLEANRQVIFFSFAFAQLSFVRFEKASTLISSLTSEDISWKDRLDQVQISADCVIAEGCEIGKKSLVKRTIIGKNCRIEEKCKLTNCVLLDHVHIKEGSVNRVFLRFSPDSPL